MLVWGAIILTVLCIGAAQLSYLVPLDVVSKCITQFISDFTAYVNSFGAFPPGFCVVVVVFLIILWKLTQKHTNFSVFRRAFDVSTRSQIWVKMHHVIIQHGFTDSPL